MTRRERIAQAVAETSETKVAQAQVRVQALKAMDKKDVFSRWMRGCHASRLSITVDIKEQRKSWMIYDIIRAEYSEVVASAVA